MICAKSVSLTVTGPKSCSTEVGVTVGTPVGCATPFNLVVSSGPDSFLNNEFTSYLYCDGGPTFGVPACVKVNAGVFTSSISQADADNMAEYAGMRYIADHNLAAGPCCSPSGSTQIEDLIWSLYAIEGPSSYTIDNDTQTLTASVVSTSPAPPLPNANYVYFQSTSFCNPFPDYTVEVTVNYNASVVGTSNDNRVALLFTNPVSVLDERFVSGTGSYVVTVLASQLVAQGPLRIAVISEGDPTLGSASIDATITIRPLIPPDLTIAGEDCAVISAIPSPFHYEDRPANDDFADAILISGASGTISGSNQYASLESGEQPPFGPFAGGGNTSIWYKWVAPASGSVTFDTDGSDFDTLLSVYTGVAVNALTLIVKNDDGPGPISPQSQVVFSATIGTTYYIRVDGFGGDTGNVVLNWA